MCVFLTQLDQRVTEPDIFKLKYLGCGVTSVRASKHINSRRFVVVIHVTLIDVNIGHFYVYGRHTTERNVRNCYITINKYEIVIGKSMHLYFFLYIKQWTFYVCT